MKQHLRLLSFTVLALVLTACQFSVVPGPFPGAVVRDATASNETVLHSGSLGAQESIVVAVRVSSGLTTIDGRGAALYFEATGEVEMLVHDRLGTPIAFSASESIITPPPPTPTTVEQISVQAIGTDNYQCIGPCVIVSAQAQTYYVLLENTTNSPINYEFYSYTRQFDDLNEPNNSTRDDRVRFVSNEAGAIETVGDEDWFRTDQSGSLTLTLKTGAPLDIRADIFRSGETNAYHTLRSGQSHPVTAGDIIRVYEENDWAGPSNVSTYYLTFP